MRLLLTILLLAGCMSARAQWPRGKPYPISNGFVQYGYIKGDSGLVMPVRDTNWTPRFAPTVVYWAHAGVDSTFWTWQGKWKKLVYSLNELDIRYQPTPATPMPPAPKVWTALVNQTGTDAPAITAVLQNTLGSVPTFVRNSEGDYSLNYNQTFANLNKVTVNVKNSNIAMVHTESWTTAAARIKTYYPLDVVDQADVLLKQSIVEITYYP